MSDSKLSELTEATSVDDDDVLYIVNDDGSRKVQVETLLGKTSSILAASAASGSTTITLPSIPPGLVAGSFVLIDAYTTEAELRSVSSVSGNTLTIAATKYAHAAGDALLMLHDCTVSPAMYGCTSMSADNWGPIQRMVLESGALGVKVKYVRALAGNTWKVSGPVCVVSSSQWEDFGIATHSTYSPDDSAGALVMVANRQFAFTASASTNIITAPDGHGMTAGGYDDVNHVKVAFSAPYGETLPGGITAGKVYYIASVIDSTTFKVSDTSGGDVLDITSDGSGYAFEAIDQLSRVYWENVRFDVSVADVNGVRMSIQQPSYIRGIRVEMRSDATDRAYGLSVGGQIGYISDAEINAAADNVTAVSLWGSGITFTNLNISGNATSSCYGVEAACHAGTITNLWTESVGIGVKLTGENRGFAVDGIWLNANSSTSSIALQVDDASLARDSSYRVCPIYWGTSGYHILHDVFRGLDLYTAGYTTDKSLIATDTQGTYMGHVQEGRNNSDLGYKAPTLNHRVMVWKSADYALRYIDKGVIVNSSGGNRTITLPTAAGWFGHEFVIHHVTGSSNSCTLDGAGSETIDGSTTKTVASGSSFRIMSNGSNWVGV